MDESLKPKGGNMPERKTPEQEAHDNWEMLRSTPLHQSESLDAKGMLEVLNDIGVSGKNPDKEDMEKGHPHTEASESF